MPPSTPFVAAPGRPRSKPAATALPGIDQVAAADRTMLLTWWHQLFGTEVPKGLSQSFLRRFIAFEVQCRQQGGLPKSLHAQIARIDHKTERKPSRTLKSGGRLLREWGGVTHVVEVTDAGCHWNGQTHRSLSAVARAITGAQWSGPRFFGIAPAANSSKPAGQAPKTKAPQVGKGEAP